MARLSKSARDALKQAGKWKPRELTEADKLKFFCSSAEKANRVVPFQEAARKDYTPDVVLALDHDVLQDSVSKFLDSTDFFEWQPEIFVAEKPKEEVIPDAVALALANRMVDTSDFEPTSSHKLPNVALPDQLMAYLSMFGNVRDGFWSADYIDVEHHVKALLWAGHQVSSGDTAHDVFGRFWLPTSPHDDRSAHTIAVRMLEYFQQFGDIGLEPLRVSLFSGLIPKSVSHGLARLPPGEGELVQKLFWSYKDAPHFHKHFSDREMLKFLKPFGLEWKSPSSSHLCFNKSLRDLTVMAEKRWVGVGLGSANVPTIYVNDIADEPGSRAQVVFVAGEEVYAPSAVNSEDIVLARSFPLRAVHASQCGMSCSYSGDEDVGIVSFGDLVVENQRLDDEDDSVPSDVEFVY